MNNQDKQRLAPITRDGRVIGHGQQLAMKRAKRAKRPEMSSGHVTEGRNHRRKVARIEARNQAAVAAKEARDLQLAVIRKNRVPMKKVPGLLVYLGRRYKKKTKQAHRSVVTLTRFPDGNHAPEGCEVTFHYTKGLRCIRTEVV